MAIIDYLKEGLSGLPKHQTFEDDYGDKYDVTKVHELVKDLPISEYPISKLDSVFDEQTWSDDEDNLITPNDVLQNPEKYKSHIDRIKHAEMYPIIIAPDGEIIDGVHRLVKAKLNKDKYIKAIVVDNWDTIDNAQIKKEEN